MLSIWSSVAFLAPPRTVTLVWDDVTLNMPSAAECCKPAAECCKPSGKCQGISHCLQSGHPEKKNETKLTLDQELLLRHPARKRIGPIA